MEARGFFLIVVSLLAGGFFAAWYSGWRIRKKITYMLDALEDKELNFRFREDKRKDRRLHRVLNRMKRIYGKELEELREKERFYGLMLDKVRTGVVVVNDRDGHVAYCNLAALSLLGLGSLVNLKQLSVIGPEVSEAFFSVSEDNEKQARFLTEIAARTVLLKASCLKVDGKEMKIIAFDDISAEMDEKESVSWTRLVRTLTHEIMNTVTPVASLSDALLAELGKKAESRLLSREKGRECSRLSGQGFPSEEGEAEAVRSEAGRIDLQASLETISASSKGLLKFVDSYRKLAHVAMPSRKVTYLRELVDRVLNLARPLLEEAGAVCSYQERSDDIILYADIDQICQVLFNLLNNALQAGATEIRIRAYIDAAENVVMEVANNGMPVPASSKEDIFVPFYTTKQSGTGLGLSLSRQIMRLHNGALRLSSSNSEETVFVLLFG